MDWFQQVVLVRKKEMDIMQMKYECKCGSVDFFTEPTGNHIGL